MLHFSGIAYGMVELIRRVIPRDIVGGHVGKLKRMDAVVHGKALPTILISSMLTLSSNVRSIWNHRCCKCATISCFMLLT
jgi:hypothetical protein